MKANFAVKDAMQRDSGHYSCLVLPSQCFREDRLTGNNEVALRVRGQLSLVINFFVCFLNDHTVTSMYFLSPESFTFVLLTVFSTVAVMLLFGICFWLIYKAGQIIPQFGPSHQWIIKSKLSSFHFNRVVHFMVRSCTTCR